METEVSLRTSDQLAFLIINVVSSLKKTIADLKSWFSDTVLEKNARKTDSYYLLFIYFDKCMTLQNNYETNVPKPDLNALQAYKRCPLRTANLLDASDM